MASVYNRGTRAVPKWYAQVKQADGTWKCIRVHATTKPEAREAAEDMQRRIDEGKPPVVREEPSENCGELMEKWIASLTNRNAKDDKSRVRRALIPKFKDMKPSEITLPIVLDWLDEMAKGPLSSGSRRAALNLLSR